MRASCCHAACAEFNRSEFIEVLQVLPFLMYLSKVYTMLLGIV